MIMNNQIMNNQLYEQDFNLWRETIIQQIKKHNFNDIDWKQNMGLALLNPYNSYFLTYCTNNYWHS